MWKSERLFWSGLLCYLIATVQCQPGRQQLRGESQRHPYNRLGSRSDSRVGEKQRRLLDGDPANNPDGVNHVTRSRQPKLDQLRDRLSSSSEDEDHSHYLGTSFRNPARLSDRLKRIQAVFKSKLDEGEDGMTADSSVSTDPTGTGVQGEAFATGEQALSQDDGNSKLFTSTSITNSNVDEPTNKDTSLFSEGDVLGALCIHHQHGGPCIELEKITRHPITSLLQAPLVFSDGQSPPPAGPTASSSSSGGETKPEFTGITLPPLALPSLHPTTTTPTLIMDRSSETSSPTLSLFSFDLAAPSITPTQSSGTDTPSSPSSSITNYEATEWPSTVYRLHAQWTTLYQAPSEQPTVTFVPSNSPSISPSISGSLSSGNPSAELSHEPSSLTADNFPTQLVLFAAPSLPAIFDTSERRPSSTPSRLTASPSFSPSLSEVPSVPTISKGDSLPTTSTVMKDLEAGSSSQTKSFPPSVNKINQKSPPILPSPSPSDSPSATQSTSEEPSIPISAVTSFTSAPSTWPSDESVSQTLFSPSFVSAFDRQINTVGSSAAPSFAPNFVPLSGNPSATIPSVPTKEPSVSLYPSITPTDSRPPSVAATTASNSASETPIALNLTDPVSASATVSSAGGINTKGPSSASTVIPNASFSSLSLASLPPSSALENETTVPSGTAADTDFEFSFLAPTDTPSATESTEGGLSATPSIIAPPISTSPLSLPSLSTAPLGTATIQRSPSEAPSDVRNTSSPSAGSLEVLQADSDILSVAPSSIPSTVETSKEDPSIPPSEPTIEPSNPSAVPPNISNNTMLGSMSPSDSSPPSDSPTTADDTVEDGPSLSPSGSVDFTSAPSSTAITMLTPSSSPSVSEDGPSAISSNITNTPSSSTSSRTGGCLSYQHSVQLNPQLSLNYVMFLEDPSTGVGDLKGQLVFEGIGWVGFGRSQTGTMVYSEIVIGSGPDDVQKYSLLARATSGVVASGYQTLTDTSFVQNSTHTVVEFTKILQENGELPISAGNNTFVWAYGSSNEIHYHAERGSATIDLESC